ncbi:MAG: class I SAM-dependent methyltransferase [Actinomycetota bacterium]|nr:class I SAM-dependent methyltransferase [Actinomycetota bacterium]
MSGFSAVPKTLLIPLAARAMQPRAFPELHLDDPVAATWADRLGADLTRFESDHATMRASCVRTLWFDDQCAAFIQRHPRAVGVSIGCGLNATFARLSRRVNTSKVEWIDLDLPEVLSVRCELEGQQPHHRRLAIEDNTATWVDLVPWTVGQPIILMAEASLVYVPLPIVQTTLTRIADRFTAGGGPVAFVMDYCSPWMQRNAKRNASLKKTIGKATWAWSFHRSTDIEQLDSRYRFESQFDIMRSCGRLGAVMSASHRAITRGRLPYAVARYDVCA